MDDLSQCLKIADRLARERLKGDQDKRPLPGESPQQMRRMLDLSIPRDGCSLEELEAGLRTVLALTPSAGSQRFLSQLYAGPESAAVMGNILATVANASMYTFKAAGAMVLVEESVVGEMCRLVGYPQGEGIFVPGGSMANLSAMVLARDRAHPETRDSGVAPRLTAYASDQAHYSSSKAAAVIGIGRKNLRKMPSNDEGALKCDALRQAIEEDLSKGYRPFCIVATAGTTVLGAFDPLPEISSIARGYGLWMHVDGALGGSVLLSRRHRHLAAGCELSDSFAWNAHKLMGAPICSSALLVREKGSLQGSFGEDADYLFQDDFEFNPGRLSLQCGRRNDAMGVWAVWRRLGQRGMEQRIDKLFHLTACARQIIAREPRFDLVKEPVSVTVCFQVFGADSAAICRSLDRQGRIKVGYGLVDGQKAIRLTCVDPTMSEADLEVFFGEVLSAAAEGDPGVV